MLFIEHAFDFMKNNAKLCFIIDASFFETAYKYTRKYILDNSNVISLTHNISGFEGVASGQIILELIKSKYSKSNKVKILNIINNNVFSINQNEWYKPDDEYKFRINFNKQSQNIIYKVIDKSKDSLKLLFPKKNLRTCTMLLDMEKDFTSDYKPNEKGIKSFRYYQGSKALKNKYGILNFDKYFFYDKSLQDKINDQLKIELSKLGIKNKKRIGLGEIDIYENPKIYIRQSAKEIIASYDEQQSAANNSLYVFSLRSNSMESKEYLKFLCGYLNSDLVTFIAQQNNIIRYFRGKQPQIKISDLYTLNIPIDKKLIITISNMVTNIYKNSNIGLNKEKIDSEIYNYFKIDRNEKLFIEDSIKYFLIS